MPIPKPKRTIRRDGMSLVELMISAGIFTFVVAGAISSTVLFAKIAKDHENRADFASDMRIGMETLSFDVRNGDDIKSRSDTGFTLDFPRSASARYSYDANAKTITRTQSGTSKILFRNVSAFDVLRNIADEPSGGVLPFDDREVSIETLSFSANRGGDKTTDVTISNFTLSMRIL